MKTYILLAIIGLIAFTSCESDEIDTQGKEIYDLDVIKAEIAKKLGCDPSEVDGGYENADDEQYATPLRGNWVKVTFTAKKDIYAIQSGKVIEASKGWNGGFGTVVKIDHGNGYVSIYAHLSKLATKKGATVEKGQLVGYMGNTGLSYGTHLHHSSCQSG